MRPPTSTTTEESDPSVSSELSTLTIHVTTNSGPILNATHFLDMSEAYTLTVPTQGGAVLTATTTLGALHGLETFAQLIDFTATPARCSGLK
jgi:hexosaminidase